ncbi:MAG: helix-turn-helix domain-containing protein, partial [Acidobacteria bacterium]|nr:helix-turn-helix domain-containing protein [Acidobacteriota bacterium]
MTTVRGKKLTSKEAARLLSVSEASVKRWADSGLLPTAKTAGGHRRFRPEDVAAFKRSGVSEQNLRAIKTEFAARLRENAPEPAELDSEEALVEETFCALLNGRAEELSALLVNLHLHGQTVAAIADRFVCAAMRRVGDLWHKGELSVAQEHVATRTAMSALQNLQAVMDVPEENGLAALCC